MSTNGTSQASRLHIAVDETGTGGLNDPKQTVFAAGSLAFPQGTQAALQDAQQLGLLQVGKGLRRAKARTHAVIRRFFGWVADNGVRAQVVYVRLDDPRVRSEVTAFEQKPTRTPSRLFVPMKAVASGQNCLWTVVTTLCAALHIGRLAVFHGMRFGEVEVLFDEKSLDPRSLDARRQALASYFFGDARADLLRICRLPADAIPVKELTTRFGSDRQDPILKLPHLLCTAAKHALTEPADVTVRDMLVTSVGSEAIHDATAHFRAS